VVLENVQFEKTCCFKPELVKLLTAWHHITTYKKDIIGYQDNLGQNAFRRKKNTGQNKANISAQAENMETGSSRY